MDKTEKLNLLPCCSCEGQGIVQLDINHRVQQVYCESCCLSVPTVQQWQELPLRDHAVKDVIQEIKAAKAANVGRILLPREIDAVVTSLARIAAPRILPSRVWVGLDNGGYVEKVQVQTNAPTAEQRAAVQWRDVKLSGPAKTLPERVHDSLAGDLQNLTIENEKLRDDLQQSKVACPDCTQNDNCPGFDDCPWLEQHSDVEKPPRERREIPELTPEVVERLTRESEEIARHSQQVDPTEPLSSYSAGHAASIQKARNHLIDCISHFLDWAKHHSIR